MTEIAERSLFKFCKTVGCDVLTTRGYCRKCHRELEEAAKAAVKRAAAKPRARKKAVVE